MTDKRYVQFEFPYDDFAVKDNKTNEELWNPKVVDRLNEQEERIKDLETRNNRQYDLLKKLSDLMYKRDWKSLEKIVEDWEESDRLLQAEFKCCDGDVE